MRSSILSTRLILLAALFVIFTGCAGPLEIRYDPKTSGPFQISAPAAVFVAPFEDKRDLSGSPDKDPRNIGRIDGTVSDLTGTKLTLSEDVTETVKKAYKKELAIAGFKIVPERDEADYIVSGEVREFRLDIGARDEVAIEVTSELTNAKTNDIVWSGTSSEKGDRFAGVTGNSRATLSNYIAASLQKVIRRSIAASGANLPKAVAPQEPSVTPAAKAAGKIAITTSPERAKVYVDGVYYGFSPLTLDLAAGVYEVTIRQKGFKPFSERVSVRKDSKTEIEAELEKE